MFRKKVEQYPLWAWIFVAISAPAAQLAGRGPWLSVLLLSIVCGGLCWGIHTLSEEQPEIRRWYCVVEFLFLALILGKFAGMSAGCWPTGNSYPTVPLILLILAAFSALDGANRASRVGGVLFWFLALLYAVVLAAGAKELNISWLAPSMEPPSVLLVTVLLIPAVASFLPKEKGKASALALVILGIFATVISLLTEGTMSQSVVTSQEEPFYTFSKSLSLFGVVERFESLVSVALTLSYFALLSFLLSTAGHLADGIRFGWGRGGVICCGGIAAAVMLFCPELPGVLLALLSVFFWGLLPLLTLCAARRKKSKKFEERA